MVAFESLPLEIRYMIFEQALPSLAGPQPFCSRHDDLAMCLHGNHFRCMQDFRGAVLRVAAISHSSLIAVYPLIGLKDEQAWLKLTLEPIPYNLCIGSGCRKCILHEWRLLCSAGNRLHRVTRRHTRLE